MASLRIRNNTFYAVWRQNGKQIVRTTNITVKGAKEKKMAQHTADTMEQAAIGNITMSSALDAIRNFSSSIGIKSQIPTVCDYLEKYKPQGSESHCNNVKRAIRLFLEHIGSAMYQPLDLLSPATCRGFIEAQLKRVSVGTATNYKGYLHNAIQLAVEDEIIPRNPFSLVTMKRIQHKNTIKSVKRIPFTLEEIQRIIQLSDYPWKQIVQLCILTGGQRLGDIVTMKWSQVDWKRNIITLRTMKTGKVISTPITKALYDLLKSLYSKYEEYIFPEMATRYNRSQGYPSNEFSALLKAIGIVKPENLHQGAGNRQISDKTFHSLRHSVVSMLRVNASFSTDLIRETVGHDSEDVERGYFTPAVEAKRSIIDYLAEQISPTAETSGEGCTMLNTNRKKD